MKKILLVLTMITIVSLYVSAQNKTYIPDDVFENYLETHNAEGKVVPLGDPASMGDGIANNDSVTTANIQSVTSLDLTLMLPNIIKSLEGIQDFTALEELQCMSHNIPSLDLSSNTALKKLSCPSIQLTSLNVSSNLQLETLSCENNDLATIDLTQNKKLTKFIGTGNSFQSIDFSQNVLLKAIRVSQNELSSIDVSAQKDLNYLEISENNISEIDLLNNQELKQFTCYNTQIKKLTFKNNPKLEYLYCIGNPIDSLDLSGNPLLNVLQCSDTPISYLNVKNGNNANSSNHTFSVRNCPNLTCVTVDDVEWSTAVWKNIDPHTSFSSNCGGTPEQPDTIVVPEGKSYIQDPQFESYLETHNAAGVLVSLGDSTSMGDGIANNNLVLTANIRSVTSLNISGSRSNKIRRLKGIEDFTELQDLNCSNNGLFSLDLSSNQSLVNLDCSSNNLSTINISSNVNLQSLRCDNNSELATIDVSNNTQLIEFSGMMNSFSTLDFSKNALLERIEVMMNQLSSLDVSGAINLKSLRCFGNMNLTTIDLSTNKALTELDASLNRISELDLSQNTLLEKVDVSSNQLSSLDVSANTALTKLDITLNNISNIDLTDNQKLNKLYCSYNPIESLDLTANALLNGFDCDNTPISYLDVRNGNNKKIVNKSFSVKDSPNLNCISVDDAQWSMENWKNIDLHTFFNNNCGGTTCHDTIITEVFDTIHVTVYDTIHVTVYDTIRVTVYDSITVTDTLVINIDKSGTGVPNNESAIKIYPNPANDLVYINTGNDYQSLSEYKIKIINTLGQTVFDSFINSQIITVDVKSIGKKGLYYVHISDNDGQVIDVRKIIFQ